MKRTKKLFKALLDVTLAVLLSYLVYLDELSVFEAVILCVLYLFVGIFDKLKIEIINDNEKRENRDNSGDCKGVD